MGKRILLVCGGGASTGFLAQAITNAANNEGYDYEIFARPVDMLDSLIGEIDVLLIAPHFKFREKELIEKANNNGVCCGVIDSLAYGTMDGKTILNQINNLTGGENE
jgi:Phosphotransferase system cellobiose-specific component IIB